MNLNSNPCIELMLNDHLRKKKEKSILRKAVTYTPTYKHTHTHTRFEVKRVKNRIYGDSLVCYTIIKFPNFIQKKPRAIKASITENRYSHTHRHTQTHRPTQKPTHLIILK